MWCVFNREPGACWTPEAGIYTGQHLAAAVYLDARIINSADRMTYAKYLLPWHVVEVSGLQGVLLLSD